MLWLCIHLPTLRHEAGAASEREALERLAAWAYQWSSWVSLEARPGASRLWLELSASRALFGTPLALLGHIEAQLTQLGHRHACALAPSPTAAALLTAAPRTARAALDRQALQTRLAGLPLPLLDWPPETLSSLQAAGLRRIGELLALPPAALARRFGPECGRHLARLTGEAADPRPAFHPPSIYRARWQFDQDLHDATALLFPLQRLLQEFQGYLRGRDRAVQRFSLQLEHPRQGSTDAPASGPTCLTFGLSTPAREAQRFLLLVRERLQRLALAAPVRAMTLAAQEFCAPSILQADLFGGESQRLGTLAPLLDRLRARLGTGTVLNLSGHADHRPERAMRTLEAQPPAPAAPRATSAMPAVSAIRAASATSAVPPPAPAPLRSTAARPTALAPIPRPIDAPATLLSGPERIESGWWDGEDLRRDYYVARAPDGARLWVFRDLADGRWYLQGWWA